MVAGFALMLLPGGAWSQWMRTPAPVESHYVAAKGLSVPYTTVLPAGMQYWMRTEGVINASTTGDQADARYYITNGFPVQSGIVIQVGFKVRTNATTEQYISQTSALPYNASHDYIGPLTSGGVGPEFRFFDRNEPGTGQNYYGDNDGTILVELAQGTPEIIVKDDIMDFGVMSTRYAKTLIDSFQSYGKFPLQVRGLDIVPSTGGNIYNLLSERGLSFDLQETATNAVTVVASPTVRGDFLAQLQVKVPNAWGTGGVRNITIRGRAEGPEITTTPLLQAPSDTVDFNIIALGANTSRTVVLRNIGDSITTITNISITPQTAFTVATSTSTLALNQPVNMNFTFTPPTIGEFISRVVVSYEWGPPKTFYLKGRAGVGIPQMSTDTIDFGTILLGDVAIEDLRLENSGDVELVLSTLTIDNPVFSTPGPKTGLQVGAKYGYDYKVHFSPTVHVDPEHIGRMVLTFTNGQSRTVILRGRDRLALSTSLVMDTFYYARIGETVVVKQKLTEDVSSAKGGIRKFSQFVEFDKDILELVDVRLGSLTVADWNLISNHNGGVIDFLMTTSSSTLQGPGELALFEFRVLNSAVPGSFSVIRQSSVNFYNAEPTVASIQNGIIHVMDLCSPPRMTSNIKQSDISQNFPNPFNPITEIHYVIAEEGPVKLSLYDKFGRHVRTLADAHMPRGSYSVTVSGHELATGQYTYILESTTGRRMRHMLLIK